METNQTLMRRVTQIAATLRKVYLNRAFILIASLLTLSSISQAQVITTLASRSKCPGDTVWVSVYVQNLTNCSAGSLEFRYDPNVLTPTPLTPPQGDAPTIGYRNKSSQITGLWLVNAHNDTITLGFFNLSTPINIANGLICQLLFTVNSNNGYSPLTWNLGVDSAACMYSDFNDPFGPALPAIWANGNAHTSPSILNQPVNMTLIPGGNGSFSLTAVEANAYQWQYSTNGGLSFVNIPAGDPYSGETTSTLSINNATVGMNGYQYRCNIGGSCTAPYNNMNSNAVSLTVSIPCPTAFSMTGGGSYCPGSSGSEVGLSGSESGVFYQLKRNGTPIGSPVAGTGFPISFGPQTVVTSPSTFTAEGTNTCGTTQMTGSVAVSTYSLPIGILNPPNPNPTICSGQGTYFFVQLSGPAGYLPCTVTYKDELNNLYPSVVLSGSNNQVQIFPTTTHTYTLYSIVDNHGCSATNMSGSATINVSPSPNPTIGSNSPVCQGQDLVLNAFATGTVTYNWTHAPTGWSSTDQNPVRPNAQPNFAGTYNCQVTFTSNSCSKTVTTNVTINPPLPGPAGPISGPADVCKGQNGVVYSVGPIENADTYVWSVPFGYTIMSGLGTTAITVNIGDNAISDYVTVAGNNGCGTGDDSQLMVTAHEMPDVTWNTALTPQCINNTTYLLTGGSPAGGIYSGAGVTGNNFNASIAGLGTKTLTYSYSDAFGCAGSATNTIAVNALPVVTWNNTLTNQCVSSTFYLLSGATPPGGTYSGQGVSGGIFNASIAGTGSKTLTYTFTDGNGCTNSATNTILVNGLPPVTWTNPLTQQCVNSTSYTLTGGTPSGGVYSGPGVSGNNFNASVAGVGVKTLTYTYTDGNGCINSASNTITVNSLPVVTWGNALSAQCVNNTIYELSGGDPSGGVYSGIGVSGTNFDASVAGSGLKTLTYTYQAGNGCSNFATNSILVYNLPVANAGDDQTLNIGQSTMLSGSGSGGTGSYSYLWTPAEYLVDNTVQNPSTIAMTTTVIFTLVVTDNVSGCQSFEDQVTVTVANYPLSLNVTAFPQNICENGLTHLSAGATGGSGPYTYNWTSDPEGFTSGLSNPVAYPAVTTTYYVTVTDDFGSETGSVTVDVTPLPLTFIVAGGGFLCEGEVNGVPITLSGSEEGINYILNLNGSFFASQTGTGLPLVFGPYVTEGDYTIIASVPEIGCITPMEGGAAIVVNPLPAIFTGTAGTPDCASNGLIPIYLSGSEVNVTYRLEKDLVEVAQVVGTGLPLTLATVNESGFYTCYAYNEVTFCTNVMDLNLQIEYFPNPQPFNVSGGATFCVSGTSDVTLDGSEEGVTYTLYLNGVALENTQAGTGGPLSWAPLAEEGVYTVSGVQNISGCSTMMNGQAEIIFNDNPVANAGDDQVIPYGTSTTLEGSATGGNPESFTYLWEPAGLLADPNDQYPVTVNLTEEADFTLVVTNTETGCISDPDVVHVGISGGPLAIEVVGEPAVICEGGNAMIEVLIENGAGEYTISWTSVPEGFTSSSALIDVTPIVTTTYYVEVTDGVSTLNGEFTVTVNPLPAVFMVSGGGAACIGTEGFNIDLSSSEAGTDYFIYLDDVLFAGPLAGTGDPMMFGLYTDPGIYTIMATRQGCQSMMEGYAEIMIYPLPVVTSNPADVSVQEGNPGQFTVAASFTTSYQWQMSPDGNDFTDINDDAVYSGTNTNQLSITAATLDMSGTYYRCFLSNENCNLNSGSAMLTVYPYVAEITTTLGQFTACPGELFIPVQVTNMINVASISLSFTFTPAVLNYVSFTNINPAIADPYLISVNAVNGNLVFSYFSLTPSTILDGTLADLLFNYLGGSSALTFNMGAPEYNQYTNLNGDVLPASFINGSVNPLATAPVVNTQPTGVTVTEGANAAFHIVATGAAAYQWQVNDGMGWTDIQDDAMYSGGSTADLLITGATLGMNGYQYQCLVSEEVCGLLVISNAALLNVYPVSSAISTSIGNATACPGTQVIIPVTVSQMINVSAISLTLGWDAPVLSYVEAQNFNPAFINPGEIVLNAAPGYWAMSWYNVAPISILDGTLLDLVFDYHGGATDLTWNLLTSGACEYNDPDGNVLDAVFTNGHVDGYTVPEIVVQPSNVAILDGGNAIFTVNANNTLGYAWYVSDDNGGTWNAVTDGGVYSGSLTASLQITGADISMDGNWYHCMLSNEMCEIISANAELSVLPIIETITTTIGSATACSNTQVVLPVYTEYLYDVAAISLVLNYDPAVLTYAGHQNINPVFNPPYDGILINSYPGYWAMSWYNVTPINLSAGNLLELVFDYQGGPTNLEWDILTQGYCEYNNGNGDVLAALFFNGNVGPAGDNPVITQQPVDVNISDLGDASFMVMATGGTAYQWQESTDNGVSWNDVTDGGIYSGAMTNTLALTIVPITMDDNLYRCVITGGECSVNSASALLNVVPLGGIIETTVPDILACPGDQIIIPVSGQYIYDIAALSLTLNYDASVLTYVGSQNPNALLAAGTLNEYQFDGEWRMSWFSLTPVSIGTDNLIELIFEYHGGNTDLSWDLATPGNCEYNDFDGNVLLANFTNGSVGPNGIIPTFTSAPADMTVPHHGNAMFSVTATDATAYQWQVSTDGGNTWNDLMDNVVYNGVTTPDLYITNAIYLYNAYQYRCMVTGEICSVPSEAATLTVTPIDFVIVTTATSAAECPGNDIVVPVTVTDFYNVASISLALNYNESVLEYMGYQNVNPALTGVLLNPGNGLFMLSWYSVTPLSLGDATLFELLFHYNGGVGNMNWDVATQGYCEYTDFNGDVMAATFVDGSITSAEVIPVIVSNPVETGGFVGDPASFTASASNYVSLQWQYSMDGGTTWDDVIDDGNISGAATEMLSIAHLELEMNGYLFRLAAIGTCGHVAYTETALLNVILQPTIVTTAGSAEQCFGQVIIPVTATNFMNVAAMSLTLNFDGSQVNYVGYQNENPGFAPGILSVNAVGNQVLAGYFSIAPTTMPDGTLFELVFNSNGGITDLTWDVATLGACEYQTIQSYIIPAAFVDGNITVHPQPVVEFTSVDPVCLNADPVVLNATPQGGTFSGTGVVDGIFYPAEAGAGVWTLTYDYADEFGCTNSATQDITVYALPTYTTEISDNEICPGETVTFTNNFTGTAPWTVAMIMNGVASSFTVTDPAEIYTEAYYVTTVYEFVSVTDGNGCTNMVNIGVTITVDPVTNISGQPADVAMDEGTGTSFHVVAENATSYQWQLSTDNGTTWNDLIDGTDYTGVNTADLTVVDVDYFMSGNQFRCIVGGLCPLSTTSDVATLTVYPVIITIAGTVEQCVGEVIVPISVIHMYGMAAMSLTLNYDNSVLTYTGYQDVNNEFTNGFLAIDATNSQVKMGYFSITPADLGDALLFNLLFTSNGGFSALTWDTQTLGNCEYQNLNGDPITSVYINGSATINPLPTATAVDDMQAICLGQSATVAYNLTGTAPWTIEVSSTAGSGGPLIAVVVVETSPYEVTVTPAETTTWTITSIVDANGCVSTEPVSAMVVVNELPDATLAVSNDVICAGDQITLTVNFNAGLAPYTLVLNNEGVDETYTVTNNTFDLVYTPTGPVANYSIVSITDANNCYNVPVASVSVTVNPLPVVTLDPAGPLCDESAPIALNGLPFGGQYSGTGVAGDMFDPAVAGPGAWTVTYTYTNENNCVNSASQVIVVNALPVVYTVVGGGPYCAGGIGVIVGMNGSETGIHYQLYKDGVYTGQTILGNGSVINFGSQTLGGIYTVIAVNPATLCEIWMDGQAEVFVNPVPNVYAGGYSIICQGTSTTINAVVTGGTPPYNYQWSPATGLNNPTIQNPIASPAGTTFYTLVVTDMNGCTDSDNALVVVNPAPVVNAGVDKTIVSGGSVTMTASVAGGLPPYNYTWTPAIGLSNPNVLNPVASPLVTTTYTLEVTDNRGCVSSDQVVINVTDVPFGYDITGFVTYDNSVSTPLNNTTVTLTSGSTLVGSTLTTSTGEYVFSPLPNGTYTTEGASTKPWGGGNSLDALLISRHFVNLQPLAGLRLQAADCDGNGVVNAADGLLVMRRSVLMIDEFPVGDWIFETKTVTVNNGTVANNFMGLCYGDVNGSYVPAAKFGPSVMLDFLGTLGIETNEEFELPIMAGKDLNVGAVSLVLSIPAGLDVISVSPAEELKSTNFIYNIVDGKLYIEWYTLNNTTMNMGETLFTMTVKTNKFADTKEFAFNVDGESVMGDANARVIEGALIRIPKVRIIEGIFNLSNNYPNPFAHTTDITYTLPETAKVTLMVYNTIGDLVAILVNEEQNAGNYLIRFDGSKLDQGVYFYRMIVNGINKNYEDVHRMIISR
ncbi:MAG: cohesin domain-containing protein [Bacteroidales bacterium]